VSLTFIGSIQRSAPFAGISVADNLTTFVALRKWGDDDFAVVDVRFFTAEDGSGLALCPYKKEFQKHMTVYDGDFNFNRALRDFCITHGVARLGYSAQEVTINAGAVELAAVDATQVDRALKVLRETSPIKDKKETTGILAYFINSLPKTGGLDAALDRVEPVLALLYAIVASSEVEAREQRARDMRVMKQSRKEAFDIIMRNGLRIRTNKDGAIMTIRNGAGCLAPEEYADA
jgi:hypothetical protein